MTRARPLVLLALAAVLALALAACGDDGLEPAASQSAVDQLLQDTFSGDEQVDSGRLDLRIDMAARGAAAGGPAGPVALRLSGPFESEGAGRLPRFALDARVDGGLVRLDVGATSTGDAGYVRFDGEDYEVPGLAWRQLEAAYEQAQKQGGSSFGALGLNPRRWLTDARIAGEGRVGDVDTIRITGTVAVGALLDDLDTALGRAAALGLPYAGRLPDRLSPAERRRAERAVERAQVEIHTGRDDHILRRLRVELRVADEEAGRVRVDLDLSLTGVNDDQDISAPSDPRPFDELMQRLGGLGFALGGLGGGGGGSGGGGGPWPGGGAVLERYADCVDRAAGDLADTRRCARLLRP